MSTLERPDAEIAAMVGPYVQEARELRTSIGEVMGTPPSFATTEGLLEMRSGDIFGRVPLGEAEERTIPGPAGPLEVRVMHPEGPPRAVYLHLHGGGWCTGAAVAADTANLQLARTAHVAVVSVDYRLAPEFPWPACADDAEAAAVWLLGQGASEFGTDRLVLGGDSSGAHLAAITAVRIRDRHDAISQLVAANLAFGVFDLGLTPSQRQGATDAVLPRAAIEACYAHLAPGSSPESRRDPTLSPLYADLRNLCPALFTVGTHDLLVDDSLFMAERWSLAGNSARLDIYPEAVHGFCALPIEMGRVALERMDAWVAEQVSPSPKP